MPISATGPRNRRPAGHGFTLPRRPVEHGFTPLRRSAEYGFTPARPSAEHGFTPARPSAEHGFTLVELMVVVTVIALAAGAVAWSLPDPRGRIGEEASRFALRVRAAHDLAIVEARPVSVWVTAGGYGFETRAGRAWQALGERPLTVERWAEGTRATLADPGAKLRVVFDATGAADRPAEVILQRRRARVSVRVDTDGSVAVGG